METKSCSRSHVKFWEGLAGCAICQFFLGDCKHHIYGLVKLLIRVDTYLSHVFVGPNFKILKLTRCFIVGSFCAKIPMGQKSNVKKMHGGDAPAEN